MTRKNCRCSLIGLCMTLFLLSGAPHNVGAQEHDLPTSSLLYRKIADIDWSPDSTQLVVVYDEGTIEIRDSSGQIEKSFHIPSSPYMIDWNPIPEKHQVVMASWDGLVQIIDVITEQVVLEEEFGSGGFLARWSPDGSRLAISGEGPGLNAYYVYFVDPISGTIIEQTDDFRYDGVSAVEWSPDGSQIALGDGRATVVIVNAVTGETLMEIITNPDISMDDWIRALAWSPDGSRLVTAADKRFVRVWDIAAGDELFSIETFFKDVAWSPDGSLLAGVEFQDVLIVDAETGEILQTTSGGHQKEVIAWSPDGTKLAYDGNVDDSVEIIKVSELGLIVPTPESTTQP